MPNNILKSFHPTISNWFSATFAAPSPPQQKGWPEIAAGNHTLILAPTGSGKTLAAFLWCMDDILRRESGAEGGVCGIHTLYVSPLKALNNDIHRNLQEPIKGISRQAIAAGEKPPELRALVRTGDTPAHARRAMTKNPPHILITTPESLYLLITSEKGREIFRDLRYLILDEIHALSNSKRGVHLCLSLERLMPLCRQEPVRIGLSATQRPLGRIAAFLGGRIFNSATGRLMERPVKIVDCGQRKDLDLKVISPVKNFSDLPESTVWPAVIDQLYELITSHKTTLVFARMRSQTERIARLLNEKHQTVTGRSGEILALAHHGSISRESRYDIENRLKAGEIPVVIATASLELGIDIGSIDLVVQLEAPVNVSSALQKVGRSGHLLSATSKGRIIPMYPSGLDDAVAMAHFMQRGEIEETRVPENCLDVLAQQLVAELSMCEWQREALYQLVRQSYCFRNLSKDAFNQVLEMLAGRYAESPLRNLQPRISWDRVNDRLIGLRGSRMLAVMNGGTIPDRGYFAVYLADSNVRLGEMEEEFVFESRVGHVFYLGNNEWRIEEIKQDRIVVTPVRSIKPRAPFWKGDLVHRSFETSQKIGAFRRKLLEHLEGETGKPGCLFSDQDTKTNMFAYLRRQQEATGKIPTDLTIVAEWFRDSVDEPHLILHTCCGARVNGLLAMALAALIEKRYGTQVQYSSDDDGLIIRVLNTNEPLPIEQLLQTPTSEMESLLLKTLAEAPIFSVRFRYNAARALILSRSQPGKRIPLWLQRLRAADLLQVVRQYPDFPILIETYRDCLNDVFDLDAFKQVLQQLHSGQVRVHVVFTPAPSPMASGLLFDFVSENMYEMDRSRLPGQIATVSSALLADILDHEEIPAIVPRQLIDKAEARWLHLASTTWAKDVEMLFAIIEKMAPISTGELKKRSAGRLNDWLKQLLFAKRIIEINTGWIPAHEQQLFLTPESASVPDGESPNLSSSIYASNSERAKELIRRYLRVRGPVTMADIATALGHSQSEIEPVLLGLQKEKEIVRGRLVLDEAAEYWCDRYNFAELYRHAVAERRKFSKPAGRAEFYRFLWQWHKIDCPGQALNELLNRYSGFRLPKLVFEREVLRSRLTAQNPGQLPDKLRDFEQKIRSGNFIVRAHRDRLAGRVLLDFIPRGTGIMFFDDQETEDEPESLSKESTAVLQFLQENGASLLRDLSDGAGLTALQVKQALRELAKSGLVTSDNYSAFIGNLQAQPDKSTGKRDPLWLPQPLPQWTANHGRRQRGRRAIRATVREQVLFSDSRWFPTTAFAVMGKTVSAQQRAEKQARLLLQRYGFLAKECYRREQGLLPWFNIFQALRRLEWQGEIRRGYYVEGLSGMQFALPEAVEMLQKVQSEPEDSVAKPALLCTIDPALPFGRGFEWALQDLTGKKVTVKRGAANHLIFLGAAPVFYSENYATRLLQLAQISEADLAVCAAVIKTFLLLPAVLRPRKKIEIHQINDQPAARSELAGIFLALGFEAEGEKIVLWPSRVGAGNWGCDSKLFYNLHHFT